MILCRTYCRPVNMTFSKIIKKISLSFCFTVLSILFFQTIPSIVHAELSKLTESIASYNLMQQQLSLSDGSYKGEEGILRINPEVARSLGMNVLVTQDYLSGVEMFEKADDLFEKAVEAMTAQEEQAPSQGSHVERLADYALQYIRTLESARNHMMKYAYQITIENDERLNKEICTAHLEALLKESLQMTSYNLRDALGSFYNRCQAISDEKPLTSENVEFVNHVFFEFTQKASRQYLARFDLDRCNGNGSADQDPGWKTVLENEVSPYAAFLETILEQRQNQGYPVAPLLFMALMKQESAYNPHAVSSVGAAGLTQIMPATGKGLGMKNIFSPSYFDEAQDYLKKELQQKEGALALIPKMTGEDRLVLARQARKMMQASLACKEKRTLLYARYERDLLQSKSDDRLDPSKAIEFGFRYFADMMKRQKGDISLALACYNAGPHRVKQYSGLPPYSETISFRNHVLDYYKDYLSRLNKQVALSEGH